MGFTAKRDQQICQEVEPCFVKTQWKPADQLFGSSCRWQRFTGGQTASEGDNVLDCSGPEGWPCLLFYQHCDRVPATVSPEGAATVESEKVPVYRLTIQDVFEGVEQGQEQPVGGPGRGEGAGVAAAQHAAPTTAASPKGAAIVEREEQVYSPPPQDMSQGVQQGQDQPAGGLGRGDGAAGTGAAGAVQTAAEMVGALPLP